MSTDFNLSCPLPLRDYPTVQMAHGGGGRLMRQLIESLFLPAFTDPNLPRIAPHDSTVLPFPDGRVAMTTDTFVVSPLFFPGGDIGKLAVYGTVNDLAMSGAKPLYLTAGFILEEGFSMELLAKIVQSMHAAAVEADVKIVAGDTKVVDRGKGDGIFINTAGVGVVPEEIEIAPRRVKPGDAVFISGDLGRHGMTIMSVRESLGFQSELQSDCASLVSLVETLLECGADIHCLRDLTRGGLAAALNEIALDVNVGIELMEEDIPVIPAVASACEILGLDPLYVANEGRLVAFVDPNSAERVKEILEKHPAAVGPAFIGKVTGEHPGTVVMHNAFGSSRIVDLLSGEQLPRIC